MGRGKACQANGSVPFARRDAGQGDISLWPPVVDAKIVAVLFAKGAPSAGQFVIARAKDEAISCSCGREWGCKECQVTLKGSFGPVTVGEDIRIAKGRWDYNPPSQQRYGKAFFWVNEIDRSDPVSRDAVVRYLQKLPGVGETLAEAIVAHVSGSGAFDGRKVLAAIDQDPQLLLSVKTEAGRGYTGDLDELVAKWEELRGSQQAMLFLSSLGFGDTLSAKIIEKFGAETIDIVKDNPYAICEIDGIGFKTADRVGENRSIGVDDPRRVAYGIHFVLDEIKRDGHICMTFEQLMETAPTFLDRRGSQPSEQVLRDTITQMVADGRVVLDKDPVDGIERLYNKQQYVVETRLYNQLHKLLTAAPFDKPKDLVYDAKTGLTPEQFGAIHNAFRERLSILTGGPGTGKTTTLRGLLDKLDQYDQSYLCLAPTGKAAKRMEESTGRPASTIHRVLGYDGTEPPHSVDEDPSETLLSHFIHKVGQQKIKGKPIDVVVIDEVSMLDMDLAERVFSHIGPDTRVVLVGDPDQLPPVGVGSVLLDLLESERVPTTSLTKVFRQAQGSLLVVNAHRIKDGLEPFWSAQEAEAALGHPVKEDWQLVEVASEREAVQKVEAAVERLAEDLGVAETEVMVTAPFRKGRVGVYALNKLLQRRHNRYGKLIRPSETDPIKNGDLVMNTKNRYVRTKNADGKLHDVFNGDIGKVVGWNDDMKTALIDFGGAAPQPFGKNELEDVVPAYAATTHKLQGSEAPAIICPLSGSGYAEDKLVTRNLLYTAWTRARERCVVIASKDAVRRALARDGSQRQTTLDLKLGRLEPRLASRAEVMAETERRYEDWTSRSARKRGRNKSLNVRLNQVGEAVPAAAAAAAA